MLHDAMEQAGYARPIDVVVHPRRARFPARTRSGSMAPAETVTLTHTVRDRAVFAHGALEAAKWLNGRRGWFTMQDMIDSTEFDGSEFAIRFAGSAMVVRNDEPEPGTGTWNRNRNGGLTPCD